MGYIFRLVIVFNLLKNKQLTFIKSIFFFKSIKVVGNDAAYIHLCIEVKSFKGRPIL